MDSSDKSENIWNSFVGILASDVQRSIDTLKSQDHQGHRRDVVRTISAAVEGVSWIYRTHIAEIADSLNLSDPHFDLAFSETTYSVSDKGQLKMRPNHIPVVTMIKLITTRAKQICPDLTADFNNSGWVSLQKTVVVRNRITHPKSKKDLTISKEEIEHARIGFFWFVSFVPNVMEQTSAVATDFIQTARQFLADLKSGDETALRIYESVIPNEDADKDS